MRRYLVAGNWKMNMGPAAGRELAAGVQNLLKGRELGGDVLVCPPFVTIPAVAEVATGAPVLLGAQNCADQEKGAFTGEVSVTMLKEAGVRYVIIAHSERREYQREDDDLFVRKINLIHAAGLKAIFCFGEKLEERKAGRAEDGHPAAGAGDPRLHARCRGRSHGPGRGRRHAHPLRRQLQARQRPRADRPAGCGWRPHRRRGPQTRGLRGHCRRSRSRPGLTPLMQRNLP